LDGLLITGAVAAVRWAARKGAPEGSWLAGKSKMLVAVALANRMARTAFLEHHTWRRGAVSRIPCELSAVSKTYKVEVLRCSQVFIPWRHWKPFWDTCI
jgi:hypothetical protein